MAPEVLAVVESIPGLWRDHFFPSIPRCHLLVPCLISICTLYIDPTHRRIKSSKAASCLSWFPWTRLRWLLKLSKRGHDFSLDLHPVTWQRNFLVGAVSGIDPGCLLLTCLSRSLVVLNPSGRVHPVTSQTNGFLCRKSCFLQFISFHQVNDFEVRTSIRMGS